MLGVRAHCFFFCCCWWFFCWWWWGVCGSFCFAVVMAGGSHPDPFRTRSLSLPAPMVLLLWWGWESRSLPRFFFGLLLPFGVAGAFFAPPCEQVNQWFLMVFERSDRKGVVFGAGQ